MRNIESINWSDIGGLEDVKAGLKECITCVYARPEALKRLNIAPTKGILLYGPPGGGKTLLAKAVATEFSAKFIPLSIPNLIQHEIGESEKTLAKIFDKAKLFRPSVIFIDEIECAFGTRNSGGDSTNGLISQLALEFDNLKYSPGVIVLAATNYPSGIDRSLLRPGRFDKLYYIPPPDIEERKAILLTGFERKIISDNVDLQSVDLQSIAHETEHFSGADLRRLMDRATLYAYQRAKIIRPEGQSVKLQLKKEDFEEALKVVEPTINSLDIDRLKAFLE
ncbi:AAA-domain-containing protein [Conidiobolus coronatus NRRL 28638]|uniref:AAA-domain-containing protein n=1 Tax=Conidiobolus coronatus (strain ATCC 28846 / CBS 209.66 / NRRL 28638) TaxID=796925 RepID=A0A137P530_CONC2|nr:AAA-domain-containing protein [Conidiobolus coronatus NRRL 28638]|eukprot:KXN70122.1 AAA-domain-containing protein [Conidiobolus coronatus NRRL 28638]